MRHPIQLDWDVLEVEEEEWTVLTTIPADQNVGRPHHRSQRQAWLGVLTVAVVALTLLTVRIWRKAEEGVAQIEQDLGALVQAETLAAHKHSRAALPLTGVATVRINASGAMVHVVITETLPSGKTISTRQTHFYRPASGAWRRTQPLSSFWGRAAELETKTIHFDFHELDRPYVEQVAEPLDAYNQTLRHLLGLPALAQPITVTIAPTYVQPGVIAPDAPIVHSSPVLYFVSDESERADKLRMSTRAILLSRSIEEASAFHHVAPTWRPLLSSLHAWLVLQGDHLPLPQDSTEQGAAPHKGCTPYALGALLADNTDDYVFTPGYAAYRASGVSASTNAFFDCLVYCDHIDDLPALLDGMSRHQHWSTLAPATLAMSVQDVGRMWSCKDEGY